MWETIWMTFPPRRWSDTMRCCRSGWPGLCFVVNPRVLSSNKVNFGLLFAPFSPLLFERVGSFIPLYRRILLASYLIIYQTCMWYVESERCWYYYFFIFFIFYLLLFYFIFHPQYFQFIIKSSFPHPFAGLHRNSHPQHQGSRPNGALHWEEPSKPLHHPLPDLCVPSRQSHSWRRQKGAYLLKLSFG